MHLHSRYGKSKGCEVLTVIEALVAVDSLDMEGESLLGQEAQLTSWMGALVPKVDV